MQKSSRIHHGRNLRKGRFSETGRAYVITAVTFERRPLFERPEVGRLVVDEFESTNESGLSETLAWVVMPDHFHWLVILRETNLGQLLQRVKSRSAIAINRYFGTHHQIWQKGFHDHALRREEALEDIARYILNNPVRKGLVDNIDRYPLWGANWLSSGIFGKRN